MGLPGFAEFPFRGREVDFPKWVGSGLASFPNRVEGVEADIRVGSGPAEFLFRGRKVYLLKWVDYGLACSPNRVEGVDA